MLRRFITYIITPLLILALTSCGEGNKRIIPSDKMARIVSELYLSDQFVEYHQSLVPLMDSTKLYDAVTAKYNYTFEDFINSVEYYIQKGDQLRRIYEEAKRILQKKRENIVTLIAKSNNTLVEWWATDSLKLWKKSELWKDPQLRIINNLIFPQEKTKWRFTDTTTIVDRPSDPLWWSNIYNAPAKTDSLYPALTRDYLILCEKREEMEKSKAQEIKKEQSQQNEKGKGIKSRKLRQKLDTRASKRVKAYKND